MAIPDGLLEQIKNDLDITWEDAATDQKMTRIIEDGVAYLDGKLGGVGDYMSPGFSRRNLIDYCRYARDDALDVFENNFTSSLIGMRNERAVSAFVEDAAQADG